MTTLSRTPLHQAHVNAGGRIVPFAGYEMSVQFAGLAVFVFTQNVLLLTAGGQVDLARETMAVQLRTALRNGSAVTPVPLRVDAGWADPKVTADAEARGAGPGGPVADR